MPDNAIPGLIESNKMKHFCRLFAIAVAMNFSGVSNAQGTAQETRPVMNFSQVVLESIGDLEIIQGSKESLIVEAEPRLLPQIKTELTDGVLYLGIHDGSFSTRFPVRFRLTVKSLSVLESHGSGNVTAEEIGGDKLAIKLTGSGDLVLGQLDVAMLDILLQGAGEASANGYATEQKIVADGAGDYQAQGLASEVADVALQGAGDVTVNAKQTLNAEISGAGILRYIGDPQLTRSGDAMGDIEKLPIESASTYHYE